MIWLCAQSPRHFLSQREESWLVLPRVAGWLLRPAQSTLGWSFAKWMFKNWAWFPLWAGGKIPCPEVIMEAGLYPLNLHVHIVHLLQGVSMRHCTKTHMRHMQIRYWPLHVTCDMHRKMTSECLHSVQFKQSTTALQRILHTAKFGDHLHTDSKKRKVPSKHQQGCCEKVLNWMWWQCWSRHVVKCNWEQIHLPSPGMRWFIYLFSFVLLLFFFFTFTNKKIQTAASNKSKSKSRP